MKIGISGSQQQKKVSMWHEFPEQPITIGVIEVVCP